MSTELKDYSNLAAVLVGITVILICIFFVYIVQLYFSHYNKK